MTAIKPAPQSKIEEKVSWSMLSQNVAFLDGRKDGQTIYGGEVSGEDLTLYSNQENDGSIIIGDVLYVDEVTNRVGIGTSTPIADLEIQTDRPGIYFNESDQSVNNKLWSFVAAGGTLFFSVRNDSDSAGESYMDVVRSSNSITQFRILRNATTGNLSIFGAGSYGGGQKVIFISNRTTAPTSNPSGGGILYCEAGALKYKGSAGTDTTIAPA